MFNKHKIIRYIEGKRLPDGGYFFAGIEPSSGADTFYAVKTLHLLGTRPRDPEGIARFFLDSDMWINDLWTLYFAVKTLKDLGQNLAPLRRYTRIIEQEKNVLGGFGTVADIYCEVTSEIESTYRAIRIAKDLGLDLEAQTIREFILSFQNRDGGFGSHGLSLLPATYHALASLRLLGLIDDGWAASQYLREKEKKCSTFYLEELFWLVRGLSFLRENPGDPEEIDTFLHECRRTNGGFCRSRNMGISTFEDTYYAVWLLKVIERLGIPVFEETPE